MIADRCADGVSIALFRAQKRTPKYGAKGTTEKAYINRHASGAKSLIACPTYASKAAGED